MDEKYLQGKADLTAPFDTTNSFEEYVENLKESCKNDVDTLQEAYDNEETSDVLDPNDTHTQGYYDAVTHLSDEYQKRLNHEDEEFNGMTVNDALDEIESWDFLDAFGDDAERLSDAVKRVMRFFGRV